MAIFDIGYLATLSSLTYYSSKSGGYGYLAEYQDEVFYLILPTCNVFKGETRINYRNAFNDLWYTHVCYCSHFVSLF